MVHNTNCTAFIITATSKKTNLLHGYYAGGSVYLTTTTSVWYAKITPTIKTARKWLEWCKEKAPEYNWKIQEVSMNAPKDVE